MHLEPTFPLAVKMQARRHGGNGFFTFSARQETVTRLVHSYSVGSRERRRQQSPDPKTA